MTLYPRREVVPVLLRLVKREDTCLLTQQAIVCFVCQAMRPSGRVACFFPSATFRRLTMDFGALTMDFSALTTYLVGRHCLLCHPALPSLCHPALDAGSREGARIGVLDPGSEAGMTEEAV